MSRVILALAAIGLVVAVWLSWPDPSADETEPTIPAAASTSSTRALATTSTGPGTTTTGVTTSHVVATVEEAEAILRELWFGWFEGIYNQDEERIREVVATNQFLKAGIDAFGSIPFSEPPKGSEIDFIEIENLKSTETCIAVWSVSKPGFLDIDAPRFGVDVLRWEDGKWRFASSWKFRDDLWETDCDSELLPLPLP